MRLIAIDPGPKQSAYVVLEDGLPDGFWKDSNHDVLSLIRNRFDPFAGSDHLAIEMVQSFGMAVGEEVFETVYWIGRFVQAWEENGRDWTFVYRKDVKMNLCRSMRAKDPNIRQAIIDRFGGKDAAIGKKKTKGPLYGFSGDCWSALAVGLTWFDTQKIGAAT